MNHKVLNINIPTQFVVLGATGDLMAKKIVPALFHLFEKRQLPAFFKIVGVSRRSMTDEEFQSLIFEKLSKHKDADIKMCGDFCKLFSYQQGEFQNEKDYLSLEEALKFRIHSDKNPDFTGKILSALREQFGGHKTAK